MAGLLVAIAVLVLALPFGTDAQAAARVLDGGQEPVLARGALRVQVTAKRPRAARLGVARLTEARRVTLRPGTHSYRLPLSRTGRARLQACGDLDIDLRGARATLKDAGEGCYRVGSAARSIAPEPDGRWKGEPVYLGGYGIGATRPATGVLGDGPMVRAFAVSDGTRTLVIADVEEQGWFAAAKDGPYGLVDVRRDAARRSHGRLDPQRVIVQSDHSHGGADLLGVWGGTTAAYRAYVMGQTVQAILTALDDMRPAQLRYGVADGTALLSNQFAYDAANKTLDGEVRVLQAVGPDGDVRHTLLNFSAHATVLGSSNTKITGDWVQAANPALEQAFGGRAVTVVGTLGRTQPADRGCPDKSLPEGEKRDLCAIGDYADRVVARAKEAAQAAEPLPAKPAVDARSYLVTDITTSAVLLGLEYGGAAIGAPLNRSLGAPWQTGPLIGTVTATARIGDVLLHSIPGEAYPQIPLKVRELAPKLRGHMTAGLSNDQLGYLIAPYEAYPEPIRRSFFNERGDEVSPIDNDNYFFNVSHTMGERVTCSLLRGVDELVPGAHGVRGSYDRCVPFANDLSSPPGADVRDGTTSASRSGTGADVRDETTSASRSGTGADVR